MTKYKIIIDGDEQDDVFDTKEEAEEYALYLCGCAHVGAETLHMSNPGDYDYDEDNFEDPDYEIVEIDQEVDEDYVEDEKMKEFHRLLDCPGVYDEDGEFERCPNCGMGLRDDNGVITCPECGPV